MALEGERIRVDFTLSKNEMLLLAGDAYKFGFMREEPRKRWTNAEYKEAARWAIEGIIALHISSKG